MKTTILTIIGCAGFVLMGNDPIGATAALFDWDGFPEYNLIGLLMFFGPVLFLIRSEGRLDD